MSNNTNNYHNEHVGSEDHSNGTVADHGNQVGLKKGPWSAAEDAVLVDYVRRNGEGNWNAVQRNTGLMRCGKSCRLRWANHLRPNLKKGGFSPDEEKIILDLHSKVGNKWARMASQLPGRTDNEIKNFWNTRLKRRQRAGLPLYPEEAITFNQENDQQIITQKKYSSPINFSSFTYKFPLMQSFHLGSFDDDHTINGGSINTYSGSSSSSAPMYNHNQNLGFQVTATPPFDDELVNNQMSFTSMIMRSSHVAPFGIRSELPSNQNCFMSYPMEATSSGDVDYNEDRRISSGLLDDLLEEAKNISCRKLAKPSTNPDYYECSNFVPIGKGKCLVGESDEEKAGKRAGKRIKFSSENCSEISEENQSCGGSSQSSIDNYGNYGTNPREGSQVNEAYSLDEDLLSLLNNFPPSTPVLPDWYNQRTNESNRESASGDHENGGVNVDQNASLTQATNEDDAPSVESAFVSCH